MRPVSAVVVRPYAAADKLACLAVFDSNRPRYFSAEERGPFAVFLDNLPGPYLVLEQNGAIVACGGIAVDADRQRADFCWGMVERAHHGQGLGKRLALERLAALGENADIRRVRLDTSQHTAGFYERLGFRITAVQPDGYGPGLDRVEMERTAAADGVPHNMQGVKQ